MGHQEQTKKYIFVVGGVMSSVGKGIAAASIGKILQAKGFVVTAIKIDPYINIDAGTMNPTEHGEVFVTDDGDETDQDLGNYERFLNTDILSGNYMTTGRVYQSVIHRERNLEYGGKCVEVVPHIPMEVIDRIEKAADAAKAEITIIEIGGTVGEYQNILFLEAARMMKIEAPDDVQVIMVSYLPIPSRVGEMKTKPTQYACRTLNASGIFPDFVLCRAEKPLDEVRKQKIAVFCNIKKEDAISAPDVNSIYEVPTNFNRDNLGDRILAKFKLEARDKKDGMKEWEDMVSSILSVTDSVKIGIIGKYFAIGEFTLSDSYISVIEAIKHACWKQGKKPDIVWLNSEEYEQSSHKLESLKEFDGIVIPGGFGSRGVEGKIMAIRYCRENKIPYFGLCYGMQCAAIEFARNVCGMEDATSEEIDEHTKHPVIHIMEEQKRKLMERDMGGSMRLGAYPCVLKEGSVAQKAYTDSQISERHRHRYEFNNAYRDSMAAKGLVISGASPDNNLVEIIELPDHPFFVGVQFHPEFKSRPLAPHPLFVAFIQAAAGRKGERGESRLQ